MEGFTQMRKRFRKSDRYGYALVLLLFVLGLGAAFVCPVKHDLAVHIYYRSFVPGNTARIFWGGGEAFSEEMSVSQVMEDRELWLSLAVQPEELQGLLFKGSDLTDSYSLAQLSFTVDGVSTGDLRAAQMADSFAIHDGEYLVSEEQDALVIQPAGEDCGLELTDGQVLEAIRNTAEDIRALRMKNRLAALVLALCAGWLCVFFREEMRRFFAAIFGKKDYFVCTGAVLLGIGLAGVAVIGLLSALGLHPDEWDVKSCLDYGMTHLFPPDMRDPEVAVTYSGYGYTKLDNATWYFLLAGKVAWIFEKLFYDFAYYRVPNILLFVFLIGITLKNLRQKNWLLLAMGISAQLWYIFAYTTADAWDYFCAFLVLLQITDPDSLLFRTLDMEKTGVQKKRFLWNCLVLGTLFGFVFLGKPYYWSVLGLAFLVLLERLVELRKDRDRCKELFGRYLTILAVFALCVGFRYSFDLIHYGFDKAAVEQEMDILYADYDKNPTTPAEDFCVTYHMKDQGYDVLEVFRQNPDWFATSYKSFCGFIEDTATGVWYYLSMGILYAFLYLCLLKEIFTGKVSVWDQFYVLVGSGLMAAALAASVLNSWIIDSQPQGRYLLPALLAAAFMASRLPKATEKWYFKAAMLLAAGLTAGYFVLVGIPQFLTVTDIPYGIRQFF